MQFANGFVAYMGRFWGNPLWPSAGRSQELEGYGIGDFAMPWVSIFYHLGNIFHASSVSMLRILVLIILVSMLFPPFILIGLD
jgi:hypothetical protein